MVRNRFSKRTNGSSAEGQSLAILSEQAIFY